MATVATLLPANKSAYVDSNNPDSNYQSGSVLLYESEGLGTDGSKYAYVQFDTSALPQGKRIQALELQLYITAKTITPPGAYRYIDWSINSQDTINLNLVTYNNTKNIPTIGLPGVIDLSDAAVNSYVAEAINKNPNASGDQFNSILQRGLKILILTNVSGYGYLISADINSASQSNPPKLLVTSTDISVSTSNASPASGFVNKTVNNVFSWGISYSTQEVFGTLVPASAKFRYRLKGAGSYTEVIASATSHTLPANTLGDGIYEWQVEVTTDAGTIATSSWMEITTVYAAAVATPVSPKSVYINGEEINTFTWSHSTTTGTSATRSDLQCSTNGSSWTDLATVTGSALTTTVAANTFSTGKLYWRVRTYNSNGIAGAWSTAVECYVLAPVPVPTISSVTSGTARPTFTWTATTQNAFELDILQSGVATIKSGVIVSTDKSYKLGGFLPDGDYTARLRAYDGNGNYSDWATHTFAISTVKPTTPTLSAVQSGNDIALTVSGAESTCYLLRDGQPIAKIQGVYTDAKTALEHTYTARNVSPADTYSDSAEVNAAPNVKGYVLSNSEGTVNLKFRNSITDDFSNIGGSAHYTGSEYPDFELSEFSDNSFNLGFAIPRKSQPDLDTLEKIIKAKELTFVKSNYGDEMYCKITGYSKNPTKHQTEVTISLVRVNHSEVIAYD